MRAEKPEIIYCIVNALLLGIIAYNKELSNQIFRKVVTWPSVGKKLI